VSDLGGTKQKPKDGTLRLVDVATQMLPGTLWVLARLIIMRKHENEERVRAERHFKRELQKADAPKATADYYAAEQAVRERTKELRRLRLARAANKKRDSVN
jgi:hypothetical protein